jgi:hypothetical protein
VDRKLFTTQSQFSCEDLFAEVEAFGSRIPQTYLWNERNLFLRIYTPEKTTFVMLHIWWHICYCDLYRFAIPGFHEALPDEVLSSLPSDYLKACQERCLEHAIIISDMINSVKSIDSDVFITDTALGICVTQVARIIFFLGPIVSIPLEKADIAMRIATCLGLLSKPAELYHTTRLLVNINPFLTTKYHY